WRAVQRSRDVESTRGHEVGQERVQAVRCGVRDVRVDGADEGRDVVGDCTGAAERLRALSEDACQVGLGGRAAQGCAQIAEDAGGMHQRPLQIDLAYGERVQRGVEIDDQ